MAEEHVTLSVRFEKGLIQGHYVRGFASVATVDGKDVVDYEGDVIDIETLREAAHEFIRSDRVSKVQHSGGQIGDIVESLMIDDEIAKSLGMTDTRRGWFIGVKVDDPGVRKEIVDGKLMAFSIGGTGIREAV